MKAKEREKRERGGTLSCGVIRGKRSGSLS